MFFLPLMLWIEPSAACNLNCPGCPTAAGRLGGVMQLANFERILNCIPRTVRIINLWHRGEPLAAPDFPQMVEFATRRGFWTQTVSNGTLLTRSDTANALVTARLRRISIAVDGASEETYRQYRSGSSLADVETGIRSLVDARRKLKSKYPRIVVECLLRRNAESEYAAVRSMALAWGIDEVKFKTFRVNDIDDTEVALKELPSDQRLWRYDLFDFKLAPRRRYSACRRLAYSAVIAWDGEVMPCCFYTKQFGLGNIFKQSWREIRSGALQEFATVVNRRGGRDKIPMCRNCTEGLKALYVNPL